MSRSEVLRIFNELIGQAKKISDLPALPTNVDNADLFEVSRGGTSYKGLGSQLPSGGGGGTVDSVVAGNGISVDATDPANPIVTNDGVLTLTGAGVDNTDPQNPTMTFPDASEVVFTPSGGIAATTVNDALIELDTEKLDKLITTNRQTASYGLVLADANKLVEMNVAGANNLTVPLNSSQAFPTGTQILIAQYGAGQTTVVATGGVTIRSSGGKLKLTGQYSMGTLIKIGTDEWYLSGDITT